MKESCTAYSLIFMLDMFKKGEDHMYCYAFNFDHLLYFVCVASFFYFYGENSYISHNLIPNPPITNFIFPRKPVNVGSHLIVHILCIKKSANVTSHLPNEHFYSCVLQISKTLQLINCTMRQTWCYSDGRNIFTSMSHSNKHLTEQSPYVGSERQQCLPNHRIY